MFFCIVKSLLFNPGYGSNRALRRRLSVIKNHIYWSDSGFWAVIVAFASCVVFVRVNMGES